MSKCTILAFLLSITLSSATAQLQYHYFDSVTVIKNSQVLPLAWAGGLNNPQFSTMDLNRDGKEDMFIFDRSNFAIKTFINTGGVGDINYTYDPSFIKKFPNNLRDFILLRDYNCDGEKDLFTQTAGGLHIYRNNYALTSDLSFTLMTPSYVVSDYGLPFMVNIFHFSTDIPGIEDIDYDGDLDLLVWPLFSSSVEYHKNNAINSSQNNCDTFLYEYITQCWGDFYENAFDNGISLDYFCKGAPDISALSENTIQDGGAHEGGTLLPVDIDGDGDRDLLIGDIGFTNLVALINGGDQQSAHMISYDTLYPSYDTSVNVIFPAAYYLDVDNDNKKDIVVASNAPGVSNNFESVWFYKNYGRTDSLVLKLENKKLLQEHMIDVGEGANPVFFDYNSDGLLDLVIGNYGYYHPSGDFKSRVSLYENTGTQNDPIFTFITDDYSALSTLNLKGIYPTFGDLDNDGDLDMLIGDYSGRLHYLENVAGLGNTANFTVNTLNYFGIDIGDFASPQLFDVDNDGLLDILVGEMRGQVNYFKNTGTLSNPQFSSTPTNNKLGDIDVYQPCCTGFSVPYMTFDASGNRVLFVGTEFGKILYYTNIDGNLSGAFTLSDSIMEVQGRVTISGGNILGQPKEELIIGDYLGGVTLLKSSDDIYVGNLSDVKDASNISVYPNPFQNELIISQHIDGKYSLTMYDLLGKNILQEQISQKNKIIHTNLIPKGVYMINISNHEEQYQFKMVKF